MEPHTPLRSGRRSSLGTSLLLGIGIAGALLPALFALCSLPGFGTSLLSLWLPLLLRWAHLIYGIAWIGASFYFIFVENSLERFPGESALAGRLWTVHGGGVYRLEKYRTAPLPLPALLHWFRWDAYLTWMTGFALLILLFYAHPEATLIDPQIAPLSPGMAVLCSLAILAAGWLAYAGLAATPLLQRPRLFALFSCLLLAALAFTLTHLYSGRGAFVQTGAVLGTIMVGNVLFVIIPAQRRFLHAAQRGERLDPAQVERTHLRSLHNNYLAFPVLFTMISNHFPFAFLGRDNWLVLFCLLLAGGTVRHAVNLRQRQQPWLPWLLGGAALVFGALIAATDPVSVIATFKEAGIRGRLRLLIESESLLNDGTAAVAFGVVVAIASGRQFGAAQIAVRLLATVGGGILCGGCVAGLALLLAGRTTDHLVETAMTTIAAYGSFLLADSFGFSGVLATISAGIFIRNSPWTNTISLRGRRAIQTFWEYAAFIANSFIFLLIGMHEASQNLLAVWLPAVAAVALVTLGRAASIYPCCLLFARSALRVDAKHQHILFWGGLRGALALALALSLPADLPLRENVIGVSFAVVAFSIFVQGLSIPPLLRGMGEIPSARREK